MNEYIKFWWNCHVGLACAPNVSPPWHNVHLNTWIANKEDLAVCRGNVDWIFKGVILIWHDCWLSGVWRRGGIQDSQRMRQKIIQGLCLGKGQDKQQWEKQERTETKDNQLVRNGITILTVMGRDSIERETVGRGDKDTEASRQTDPEMTGSQWQSYT